MSEHTITELLSPAFLSRMQNMLGDEYESFLMDIFIRKMSVHLSVHSIRPDFSICRNQVP